MCRERPCDCCAACQRDDPIGRSLTYFTVPDGENARSFSQSKQSLLTQSGRAGRRKPRQLSGVKRTPQASAAAAAFDPQATLDNQFCCAPPTPALADVMEYLSQLLASRFLISGLSYKTTFNRELRISSFPLYSI